MPAPALAASIHADVPTPAGTNPLCEAPFVNPHYQKGDGIFAVVCGGGIAAVTHEPGFGVDFLAYVDCHDEVRRPGVHPGVVQLPIARGSLGELVAKPWVTEPVRQYLQSLPAANGHEGAGMWRGLGLLAARQAHEEGQFEDMFVRAVEYVSRLHAGELAEQELVVFASQAGGLGAGVAQTVAEDGERVIAGHTVAPLNTTIVRVGATSYMGCGPRIFQNGAATLVEDLDWYLSPGRHPRATRKLTLLEVPLAGQNKRARDRCVAALVPALRCSDVHQALSLSSINWALSGPMGGITLVKPGFWLGLPAERVAGDVAAQLEPRVRALAETPPDPGQVAAIELRVESDDRHLRPTDALCNVAAREQVKPANFDDDLRVAPRYGGLVRVTVAGEAGPLSWGGLTAGDSAGTLQAYLSRPVDSESSCRQRLGLLGAMGARMDEEAELRRRELARRARATADADQKLRRATAALFEQGFWGKLFQLRSRSERVGEFKSALVRYCEAAARQGCVAFELSMLEHVARAVHATHQEIRERLSRMMSFAARHAARGPGAAPLVVTDPDLSNILRRASIHPFLDDAVLADVLAKAVRTVTIAGLAAITGADAPRPEAVVRALSKPPPLTAPWYGGGSEPAEPGMQLFVLPAVAPGVIAALRDAAGASRSPMTLLSTHTVAGAPGVVHLDVRPVSRLRELFTPQVLKGLESVRQDPPLWLSAQTTVDFVANPIHGIDIQRLMTSLSKRDAA